MDRNLSKLASLLLAAGTIHGIASVSISQTETAPAPSPAPPAQPPAEPPAPPAVSFNFKDAPFQQVLDYFSRESGLPLIPQAPAPGGTMTFISGEKYSFEEAMTILNQFLNMHKVQIRKEGNYLYLSTLADTARQSSRVFQGEVPGNVPPDEIVTLTIPLNNAKADTVAAQVKPLIAEYGAVTSIQSQNSLIIVETAAQCRRIAEIVKDVDRELVDQKTKLFPLKHAKADAVAEALKSLIRVRQVQVIINEQRGTRQQVEDTNLDGLNFFADPRTNSVLVVGPEARIKVVEELIGLLDVPDSGGGDNQMMTFALDAVTPEEAAQQVSALFRGVPEPKRPVVVPLPGAGKITIVGNAALLAQAASLLGEIDPKGGEGAARPEKIARTIALRHLTPDAAMQVLTRLSPPRQSIGARFAASPSGRSIVVLGTPSEVETAAAILEGIDAAPQRSREVRQIRLTGETPDGVLARASQLYTQSAAEELGEVASTYDAESRLLTLVGPGPALERFQSILRESRVASMDVQTRTLDVAPASPTALAARLGRLAPALLAADAAADPASAPSFEPLEELGQIIVKGEAWQFPMIQDLTEKLIKGAAASGSMQVIRVRGEKPGAVAQRAMRLYEPLSAAIPEPQRSLTVTPDDASGTLLVRGSPESVRAFSEAMAQAQQLVPPERTTRVIDVKQSKADDLVAALNEYVKAIDSIDPARAVPAPEIRVIAETNSLLVTAEALQHDLIREHVTRLDRIEQSNVPPLKLLQLRAAEATSIAGMLTEQYAQRPQSDRLARPVDVRSDPSTNTLIVSAHPDLFEEIKSFVDDLNREQKDGPERQTVLFPLKVARAEAVAKAMEQLYPQPPVPMDRLGRPMPWAQPPRDVTVAADPSSNTLMIYAPADQIESLRELASTLDRVEIPPRADLRTYRVVNADLSAIVRTLQNMSRQQILSAPATTGRPAVQVVIESEPKSSTLIVAGDDVTFETVERVLKDLSAVPVEKSLRILPIANADPEDVRQRAMAIYQAQVSQIPDANPVDVTVDKESSTLQVVADPEGMERFMRIMDELQRQAGPAREVRWIELRFAKAKDVTEMLADIIGASRTLSLRGGPDPVFEAIEATNSILVAAQPIQLAIIEQLVKGMDAKVTEDRPPLRIFQVRSAEATNLAAVLQRSFDSRPVEERGRRPVDVSADPATNTLLVSAHPDLLPEIQQLVEELNDAQALTGADREIRIFPLRIARAEELARTIDEMFPEPPMPVDRRGVPQPQLRQPKEVFVRADRATNSLIVDAPAKRLAGFEQIVNELDKDRPNTEVQVRSYRVQRAQPEAVAQTIRDLATSRALGQPAGAPVTVSVDGATRTVVVSGPEAIFAGVEEVLRSVDAPAPSLTGSVQIYHLKNARAEKLQPLLQRLLTVRLREQMDAQGIPAAQVVSLLEVAADPQSNSLVISAPEAVQAVAQELIKVLDTEASPAGRSAIRVVPLMIADANQVAATLNQAIPTLDLPGGGPVSVLAVPSTNALVLSGAEQDLAKVAELVEPLDRRPENPEAPGVETFALKQADAAVLAPVVQRLLTDQQETDPQLLRLQMQYARNRPELFKKPMIRVEPDGRTNSLIVSAPTATIELARTIITRLDTPAEAGEATALTFTPTAGDPAALAQSAQKIVNATVPQGRKPCELVADPATRSILILGSPEQTAEAAKVLADLDARALPAPTVELRVVSLKTTDATAMATTIQSLLADRGRWPAELRAAEKAGLSVPAPSVRAEASTNRLILSAPPALLGVAAELIEAMDTAGDGEAAVGVRVFQLTKGDAAGVAQALTAGLEAATRPGQPRPRVSAEASSNSVVVAGSPATLQQAADLIKSMDQAVEPESAGVRTVFLKHARAEALQPILEQILKRSSLMDRLPSWALAQAVVEGASDPADMVRVAAENRLNAIVISAPQAMLDVAEELVRQLDSQAGEGGPTSQRLVRVIPLSNSDATQMAQSIGDLFNEPGATEEPPAVRVDAASNALIVRASQAQMEEIEKLAKELDAATLAGSRQLRLIPIDRSRADAALMAQTLRRLLEERGGAKVEVLSIEDLLKEKDGPEPPTPPSPSGPRGMRAPKGHPLLGAIGASVFAMQPESASPGDSDRIVIAVDPATNSLVVVGSPRMTDRIAALASELEKQMPAEATRVRIISLPEGVDAQELRQIVEQSVQQVGRSSPANPGGFTGRVAVAADPAGGALVVWANDTDFAPVGELVASLARPDVARDVTVKVYPLQMTSAQAAARAITDLLSPSPRGQQARRIIRAMEVSLAGGDVRARIDPASVRALADPGDTSLIVSAPAEALPLIDKLIEVLDQSPVGERLSIRRYSLENARSTELVSTLQALFDAQREARGQSQAPRVRFVADGRTNSLLVTAADAQHRDVVRILAEADVEVEDDGLTLQIIPLKNAAPTTVERIVTDAVIGRDPAKSEKLRISAEDDSQILVVRGTPELLEEVRSIVASVDSADIQGLPVRSIKLERADAQQVANALTRFFDDRARMQGRRQRERQVAVAGDRRSGTLIISANDADFAQIEQLVATFDAPAPAQDLQWRIIPLQNARAKDLSEILDDMTYMLQEERMWGWRPPEDGQADKLFVKTNESTNSVVLFGTGPTLEVVAGIVKELDAPATSATKKSLRAIAVTTPADLNSVARAVREAFTESESGRFWWTSGVEQVTVEVDQVRRLIILVGKQQQVDEAAGFVEELARAAAGPQQRVQTIVLRHAEADRAATSLRNFFQARARAGGAERDAISISGSRDGNVLLVAASEGDLQVVRDLVAQIDQPELGQDRRMEVYSLTTADANDVANVLRGQFPKGDRAEDRMLVTPQPSTNSLIVSAREEDFAQIEALIAELEANQENTRIVTVALTTARAAEVGDALRAALPPSLKIRVTPVARSNSIMLTGTDEAIAIANEQIAKLDTEPPRPLVEFRRITLKNAMASDVWGTLVQLNRSRPRTPGQAEASIDYSTTENTIYFTAPPDEVEALLKMIDQLDVPVAADRKMEFVKLEFAPAEQVARALEVFYGRFAREARTPGAKNVSIVPDPATNSLMISADETEWEDIRALLKQFDRDEYDTERQLLVLPLKHADAQSVARALSEGLRAPLDAQIQRERLRQEQERRGQPARPNDRRMEDVLTDPAVLVDAEDTPSVSAEVQSNSLIIFAGKKQAERIQKIVEQLDRPGFSTGNPVHVVPVRRGRPTQLAQSINQVLGQGRTGPRAVMVVGDDASDSLLVRADEADLARIRALVDSLQQEGATQTGVHVIRVERLPAARLQPTIRAAFQSSAQELGETLSVEIDRTTNSLVIACGEELFQKINRLVQELDGALPEPQGGGALTPGVFIIDVKNNSPEQVRQMLQQLGVMSAPPADRPGIVSEAVTVVPLTSRRALAVVASPRDGEALVSLVRSLDAEPASAEEQVTVVALKKGTASDVVATLRSLLGASGDATTSGPAEALREQLRRLSIVRGQVGAPNLSIDLGVPIRLLADAGTNSVIVASSAANVSALTELVGSLDDLPAGDAVVVRIFPLENAQAARSKRVIDDLFAQGEALRRLPGTRRQGLPTTATGQALAGEIAVSVDERTNTLFVAGREEAVTLVELLIARLDSAESATWVEPSLIALQHADAQALAQTLRQVLVEGLKEPPEASGIQVQAARLRSALGGEPTTSDLFAPLSSVVITPEPNLNALIVVASPANLKIVQDLAKTLDVERASMANSVRVFPLKNAAADRVSDIVSDIFSQRRSAGSLREEDALIIRPDVRTNALIVSTSPRSFAMLEALLSTLDSDSGQVTVGLHVIPVPNYDVRQLAPKVDALMRERIQAAQRSGAAASPLDTFRVEAEPANNLLIVACSQENLQVVQELVDALTTGAGPGQGPREGQITELVSVGALPVAEAATAVRELYVNKEIERRGDGAVSAIANDRLRAILVQGTPEDVRAIKDIVARLGSAAITTTSDLKRVELASANSVEVVNLLESVLAGQPLSGRRGIGQQQALKIRYFRDTLASELEQEQGRAPTEADIDGAIRDQVTLTPDPRTNSIFVGAPDGVMTLILDIIKDLDTSRRGERRVEEFHLKNADARGMAELLRELFNLRQQDNRLVLIPTREPDPSEVTPGGDPGSLEDMRLTPVPDDRQQLAITVDARTNTLLVSGTEEYIEDVRKVVERLDSIEATERERFVYRLRNAKADEVESTLQSYFQDEADSLRQALGTAMQGSVSSQLEREVTVVGDVKSNTVLVSASPRTIDMVKQIITELDAAPPQVLIQVLLAEVTLDSASNWGLDARVKEFGGDAYTFGKLAAGATVATALGVPNLTFASEDFEILLRALEAQGKLQVLSRPQLMVNNNEEATFLAGENIPLVQSVENLQDGNTRANITREDVGIILRVTPSISTDGFVRLDVEPEISAVSTEKTQITEDFSADRLSQRRLATVVRVRDGQTVVLGGLIQTRQEERRTKVPGIGDIPGLGLLFQSKKIDDVKTELLVILTPRVVPSSELDAGVAIDRLTGHEINRVTPSDRIRAEMEDSAPRAPEPEGMAPPPVREQSPSGRPGASLSEWPPR